LNIPDNLPFIAPVGVTMNGYTLPRSQYQMFCQYGQAAELLSVAIQPAVTAAFGTTASGAPLVTAKIVDGVNGYVTVEGGPPQPEQLYMEFAEAFPPEPPPVGPLPTDVSVWVVEFEDNIGGESFQDLDPAAQLLYRQFFPDQIDQGAQGWTAPMGPYINMDVLEDGGVIELKWSPHPQIAVTVNPTSKLGLKLAKLKAAKEAKA
jgi:hypothetical protein